MNRVKNEIKLSGRQSLFINNMLLIQLVFCFVICAFSLVTANDIKDQSADFKENFGERQFLRVVDMFDGLDDDFFYSPNYIGKMKYVYEHMRENKKLNFYSQATNPVCIENAPDDVRFSDYQPEDEEEFSLEEYAFDLKAYDGKIHYYNDVKCVWMGQGGLEANGIEITDGRSFEKKDFESYTDGDTIPVLMGNNYKKYYKLGDTFKADMFTVNLNFTVVGFFDKGTALYMLELTCGFHELDDYIMLPLCDTPGELDEDQHVRLMDLYHFKINGFCSTTLAPAEAQNEVKAICKEVGFEPPLLVCDSHNYESQELMMDMESFSSVINTLAVILVFFSIMTVILFVVNRIRKDLRYYAILLANGFTFEDLIVIVSAPPVILSLAAFGLSCIAVFVVCELAYWQIIIKSLLMLLLVVLLIDIICAAAAYTELKKHDLAVYLRKK